MPPPIPKLIGKYRIEGEIGRGASSVESAAARCQARSYGLVHRDLKPANIMLQVDGNVKVTDFGTALSVRGETTQMLGLMGSPYYMSPEQVREEQLTHQSDMFALGVVMYELLTGHRMRTATAVAETDVTVLEVPNAALRQASDDLQKRFDRVFIQLLVQRLMATTAKVGNWGMDSTLGLGHGDGAQQAAHPTGRKLSS